MELEVKEKTLIVPDLLWSCMKEFYKNLRWENFTKEMRVKKYPWSFTHGDFYANNIMWIPDDDQCHVRILDWEMAGISLGPQELGRYVISHLDIYVHGLEVQQELVNTYYQELLLNNPSIRETMSLELLWEMFVLGGLREWLWIVPILLRWNPDHTEFVLKKLDKFCEIHGVKPEDVGYME